MALEVPKAEKVYTTTYQNFRGVDYTNDASNAWYRRSPTGLNMLPTMDGKPYKRKGWEIELTPADFRSAVDAEYPSPETSPVTSSTPVIPDKTYYFELGGYSYLMIFNNLGVFSYYQNPQDSSASAFPRLLVYHRKYIDANNTAHEFPAKPDSKRAFFFEGGGTAGFYMFVGMNLYRYDGARFLEVEPYVPMVLFACDASGAGTQLESVNILSNKRIVGYTCDGVKTVYVIPQGFDTGTVTIEQLDENGEWQTLTAGTDYTLDATDGTATFATAPQVSAAGEDNMRITYVPNPANQTTWQYTDVTVNRGEKTITSKQTTYQYQYNFEKKDNGVWETENVTYAHGGATFDASNCLINSTTKQKQLNVQYISSNTWTNLSSSYYYSEESAYTNDYYVRGNIALFTSNIPPSSSKSVTDYGSWEYITGKKRNINGKVYTNYYRRLRKIIVTQKYRVRISYSMRKYTNPMVQAFSTCAKTLVFGTGIINQVFMTASPVKDYNTRVWYSMATDPSYFPDTNYIEVGATDKPIMGLLKVGEFLGVIKKGTATGTSIYLAYPTSFDDDTTYAVKQNVNGIGAISSGAFNSLNEEPLFLSQDGIMGIEVSEDDTDRQLRNRSFYINKPMCAEDCLSKAISFVHDGMYYLAVNNKCYVLDGSQKNSWENTKTNLQYEAYVLDNVPAQCFCTFDKELWFTDFKGNLCRFMTEEDNAYHDAYSVDAPVWTTTTSPTNNVYAKTALTGTNTEFNVSDTIKKTDTDTWYTITEVGDTTVTVGAGVPINAVWSTIADDDGAAHYFKNFRKKGNVVSLLPSSDSGVDVYIKADEKDPIYVGTVDAKNNELPFDYYTRKKVKKYKRLQIICKNNILDDSFGIDQIIKSYTVGNYAKARK